MSLDNIHMKMLYVENYYIYGNVRLMKESKM